MTTSRDIRLNVTAEVKKYVAEMRKIPGTTEKQAAAAGRALAKELGKAEAKAATDAKRAAGQASSAWSAVGAVIATMVTSQAAAAVKSTVDEVVGLRLELAELSTRTNISTETLAGFRQALAASGNELSSIESALTQFPKRMLDAAGGTGEAVNALSALGVEVVGTDGHLRSTDDTLREVVSKLKAMENPTERAAAATAIFGETGTKLMEALSGGDLEAFIEQTEAFGADVGPEAIATAQAWQRASAELSAVLAGLKAEVVDNLISVEKLEGFSTGLVATWTALKELTKDVSVEFVTFTGQLAEVMTLGASSADGVREFRETWYETQGTAMDRTAEVVAELIRQREATKAIKDAASDASPAIISQAMATREAAKAARELEQAVARVRSIEDALFRASADAQDDRLNEIERVTEAYRQQIVEVDRLAAEAARTGAGDQEMVEALAADARIAIEERMQREIAAIREAARMAEDEAAQAQMDEQSRLAEEASAARRAQMEAERASVIGYGFQALAVFQQVAEQSKAGAKAAFLASKVSALGSIAVNTSEAITKGIATFGPPPSPAGIAAIAAASTIGAAQAGLVMAQQPPAFALGGTVPQSAPLAYNNTSDERLVTARPGERIRTREQEDALMQALNRQPNYTIELDGDTLGRLVDRDSRRNGPLSRKLNPTGLRQHGRS